MIATCGDRVTGYHFNLRFKVNAFFVSAGKNAASAQDAILDPSVCLELINC